MQGNQHKFNPIMHNPLVSVIIPNYNYATYLHQRINSILNQHLQDFEIIILDDASTDHSIEIIKGYTSNSHVSCIKINKENTGSPFKQWIKGIEIARGKYVWIAEADDDASPHFLDTCVNFMESHPQATLCFCGSRLINQKGELIKKDANHWGKRKEKGMAIFDGNKYILHNLYWRNYIINASGVVFKREYASKLVGSSFVNMRYCGDWLFWIQMAMQGQVIEIYESLNSFRQHTTKATIKSHNNGAGIREDIYIIKYIEKNFSFISNYRKHLRRGMLYRKLFRDVHDKTAQKQVINYLQSTLSCCILDYFLERISQLLRIFLPQLPTAKRDRL